MLEWIARAADMGLPIAPPVYVPPPAVLSWTGPYVGLNGGGGWGTTDHTFTGVVAGLTASTGNFKTSAGVAGGTWGYNYQVGAWVFGAESDLDWANIRGTFTAAIPGVVTAVDQAQLAQHLPRPRRLHLGPGDALCHRRRGRRHLTATADGTVPAPLPASGSTSQSNTEVGWTAGDLTGNVEYLYVNLP